MNRWTTPDPLGSPDGPNNRIYAPVPTSQFDLLGEDAHAIYSSETYNVTMSILIVDSPEPLISQATATQWGQDIDTTWTHQGIDKTNQQQLSFNLTSNITYTTDQRAVMNWNQTYDNLVYVQQPSSNDSDYVINHKVGYWVATSGTTVLSHEAGHLMGADDKYDHTTKIPISGWENTLMGETQPPVSKDWNYIIQSLQKFNKNLDTSHLFE